MNPINSVTPPQQQPQAPAPAAPPGAQPQANPAASPPQGKVPPALQPLVDQTNIIEWWMENVLMQSPDGQKIVTDYMNMAPLVIQALKDHPDKQQILQELMTKYLLPTTAAIKEGDYETALKNYFCLMSYASKYAASLQQDPEIEATLQGFAADNDQKEQDPSEAARVLGGAEGGETSAMDAASSPMGMSKEPMQGQQPPPSGAGASMPMQPPMAPPPSPAAAPAAPMAPQPAPPAGASPINNIKPRGRP